MSAWVAMLVGYLIVEGRARLLSYIRRIYMYVLLHEGTVQVPGNYFIPVSR